MISEAKLRDNVVAGWPEIIARLIEFGLLYRAAPRQVGLPSVTPEIVDRWLYPYRLLRQQRRYGANAFLITRLTVNNVPAPSWKALRRLEKRRTHEARGEYNGYV